MNNRRLFDAILHRGPALVPAFAPVSGAPLPPPDRRQGWHAMSSGSEPKRTIRAGRRRPSGSTEPSERETAQAPQRERPSTEARPTGTGYSTGGGQSYQQPSSSSSGSQLPQISLGKLSPKMLMIIVGILAVVGLCCCIYMATSGGLQGLNIGNVDTSQEQETADLSQVWATEVPQQVWATEVPEQVQPTPIIIRATKTPKVVKPTSTPAPAKPTRTPAPTQVVVQPPASSADQKWLIMLYQDADDKILEQDIYIDLNEAEKAGSTDRVQIVAQMDRYRGGFSDDGNWTSTKRFFITQDNDLTRVRSQQIADLGEVNMSDGDTLVDFVKWAVKSYPADKYVLILSDHGMGWPGGWSDGDPGASGANADRNIPLSSATGDELFLMELDQALTDIRSQVGLDKFELIGMDACLMGHLEVLSALEPHARYAVVSQETEPSVGWAYTSFLQALNDNPDMGGGELAQLVVKSYIEEDQRITDDQARAEMVGRGSSGGGLLGGYSQVSAAQLVQQMGQNSTLTAVDLSKLPELMAATDQLAYAMTQLNQKGVAQARSYVQSFTSVFGSNVPPSYLDLGNLAGLLRDNSTNADVDQAANQVLAALNQAVIAEKHGRGKPGATGVSIYFPNSQLYQNAMTGPRSYTPVAQRFAQNSSWDDFLAYHYTGRTFQPESREIVVPDAAIPVRGPGAGGIQVSSITASGNVASPGQPVLLSTDISGENVGYVYLFAGFLDQQANSIYVADMDYLDSGDTREIDGVYYPDWGEGAFTMEFEWEPLMFAINDGATSVTAVLMPQSFGASSEEAVYTVDGIYTDAGGGESRYARLYFSNGELRQVFGFTGTDETGSPHEINPNAGDTFTVLDKWMDLDASGGAATMASQEGGTLTFGNQPFTWKEMNAAPGQYTVGFIVKDLDGNSYETYTTITVTQ